MATRETTLTQRTGGRMDQAPEWIERENAEKAARIIRAAARELIEIRFPARALLALWEETVAEGCTVDRLVLIGKRIWRLATTGLGSRERVLLEQLATLTFDGQQAVLRLGETR